MTKKQKEIKQLLGFIVLGVAILIFLINLFFFEKGPSEYNPISKWDPKILFIITLLLLISINLIFKFNGILFDNREYDPNKEISEIVRKLRLRGVLFNNIAIILFLFTIIIIFLSFYLLVKPPPQNLENEKSIVNTLTVKIAASVLLIFLVQIFFKVFKYLLRVAAFYNARADAIEFHSKDSKIDLDKLMEMFTPEKYDISELDKTSIFDNLVDALKSKLDKK